MKHLKFGFPIALFALITVSVSPSAHAQYVWNVTFDQKDDSTQSYLPFIFACTGNHCTAIVLAGRKPQEQFEFIRSDDGGLTWHEQWSVPDNGLPPAYIFVFAMQQIDSLNVVAVGDSGNIFRTFDGGVIWSRQRISGPFANTASIFGVHFHDAMNGIIGLPEYPETTTDGGVTWIQGPFTGVGSWMCHCYGPGKFAVFDENTGIIHRTSNNWVTMDSTDSVPNAASIFLDVRWTDWTDGDTIIGYGLDSGTAGCIVRTLNGGGSWYRPPLSPAEGGVTSISKISDDTLFAGRVTTASNSILFSSDFGQSWGSDTISVQSQGSYYTISTIDAIARPSPGVVLAAVQQNPSWLSTGLIIRGTLGTASVSIPAPNTVGVAYAYPNPGEETVAIGFDYRLAPVRVLDILGREVMMTRMPESGPLTLDISQLPKGIYYVIDDRERAKFVKE